MRKQLKLTVIMKAKPLGSHSLSGNQMKVSAREVPLVKCEAEGCGWRLEGWFEDGKAVFDPRHVPDDEPMVTKSGRVLGEEDLNAWAEEAEKGYDVSHLVTEDQEVVVEEPQLDTEFQYRKPRWNDGWLLARGWCWMRGHQRATLDGYAYCSFCQQALNWKTGEALGYVD